MATLAEALDALDERVTGTATMHAAAEAMASALSDVAAGYVGGDIGGSRISIEPTSGEGKAGVTTGGGYALADGGRSTVRRAAARRGSGLRTPWGPRANVSGSTWAGFGITQRAQADVMEAGKDAIRAAVSAP